MIHILRWTAIIGTCWLFWWLQQPHPIHNAYRKRTQRTFS